MMDLNPKNVHHVFSQCTASPVDDGSLRLTVEGVNSEVTFDREQLAAHAREIRGFLSRVSTFFYEDRGGGHSCALLGFRRDGSRWGALTDIEKLLALGLGLGFIRFCLERSRWDLFPDGQPYVQLDGDLFQLWATFRRPVHASESVMLPFADDQYPAPVGFDDADWFRPATFEVRKLKSRPSHVADAFYLSVIVEGFFDGSLPSWVLDPDTLLQIY